MCYFTCTSVQKRGHEDNILVHVDTGGLLQPHDALCRHMYTCMQAFPTSIFNSFPDHSGSTIRIRFNTSTSLLSPTLTVTSNFFKPSIRSSRVGNRSNSRRTIRSNVHVDHYLVTCVIYTIARCSLFEPCSHLYSELT